MRNFDLTGLTPAARFAREAYRSVTDLPDAEWVAKRALHVHVRGDSAHVALSRGTYRLYVMLANVLPTSHVVFCWRVEAAGRRTAESGDPMQLRNVQSMKSYQQEIAIPEGGTLILDLWARSFASALHYGTCKVQIGLVRTR